MASSIDMSAFPNVLDLRSRSSQMLGVSIGFLIPVWISIVLRIYVRVCMAKAFGWDDGIMIFAAMTFTSFAALLIVIGEYGYNKTVVEAYATSDFVGIWDVLTTALEYTLILNFLYVFTTILFKISLAIFFLRIVVAQWQRRLIIIPTALFTLYSLAYMFLTTFRCGPPRHILLNTARGNCLTADIITPMLYVSGIFNACMDVMFACLPTTFLWNSQMPIKTKISCCILLSMGGLGCVASIIRIAFLSNVNNQAHYLTNAINTGLVSIVEPGLAITAASLGTLRPLFQLVAEKTSLASWQSSNSKYAARSSPSKEYSSSGGRSRTTIGARSMPTDTDSMTELDTIKHGQVVMGGRPESTRSQSSLLDHEDQSAWTTYEGKGVMMTRQVRVSGR
ncbi:hypothetical protein E4T49_07319 [Aureobasidium sp. EXF-10728]|nr:hypothetical protein E4T49_07319 [Aureobasidium sp. EXF-10728]